MRPYCRTALALAATALIGCGSPSTTQRDTPSASTDGAVAAVRASAHQLTGADTDYDPLMAAIGSARFVLLGEQTHGTHEFYEERARITRRLILEKGFNAVAVEGDWPDTYRVNEYVRGVGGDATAEAALSGYTRFATWMWRNEEIRELVGWLRAHNDARPAAQDVGMYGLDVYSLYPSADAVIRYLSRVDGAAAERARTRYACFEPFRPDPQRYGAAAVSRTAANCREEAAAQLQELTQRAAHRRADPAEAARLFSALRNAHSVANAEEYFRTLYEGSASTWNLRDTRMAELVDALDAEIRAVAGAPGKIVVWAHNSHVGDARHAEAGSQGEHNIGQLIRQRYGAESALVGFFTYTGTVYAAREWDTPGRVSRVRPALEGSFSDIFHDVGRGNLLVIPRDDPRTMQELEVERLERAIGVIYRPETERQSHYFLARLARQFDAAIFIDTTSAVRPLRR